MEKFKKVDAVIKVLPLECLEQNKGQVEGVPKNPRLIRNDKFEKLKKSLTDNPGMLSLRELIVYQLPKAVTNRGKQKYMVLCGNMRFRALTDLGVKETPCKILGPTVSVQHLRAYAIKDNGSYGVWDFDALANEFDTGKLSEWGVDVSAYQVIGQDFDDSNQELDIDNFDEEMKMRIEFKPDEYNEAKTALAAINNSPEMAMLAITGWSSNDDVF